ncbi:MAG: P-type DNA transfer ATPase VirB11 [Mesorhizobium sp. 65-26]|jgi:type IV secretion system protein VirB11|nr:P-type DNA transfer ATPase VirB11 [Mesorhizobium sp.]OJX77642.1 MAG: P-type DNA transfer ATPase VirB11 [Mesorhizobium sp. 65-26]
MNAYVEFVRQQLGPLRPFLEDPQVVEISCQRPGELWIERSGSLFMQRQYAEGLGAHDLKTLAERTAAFSKQVINEENPLLSATLPDGERIQFVLAPTSLTGHCFSIRKQVMRNLSLDDYERAGAFRRTRITGEAFIDDVDHELSRLLREQKVRPFLELAAANHRSMLISGGTSTGKTTFLNAMLSIIDLHERLVLMQDAPELTPPQENVVSLIASKGDQGRARVTMSSLLATSLRLRPDRIFMGELRGDEAFDFLNAINTGHPGSMTTIHANAPREAFDRLSTLVLNSGVRMDRSDIIAYIKSIIPIVVQLRKGDEHGGRGVSEIFYADEVDEHGNRKHAV